MGRRIDNDHFWQKSILGIVQKIDKKFDISLRDMKIIAKVFERLGCTWEDLAKGNPKSWGSLREICIVYMKRQKETKGSDARS